MAATNREMARFIEYCGGLTKAAKKLNCTPDMARKMRAGERGFNPDHVRAMYYTKGFKLSWLRLFDLDYRPKL